MREAIFNSIPRPLKLGVTWGIGLFILFIGLQNSKLIVADPSTMLSVYPFREAIASGEIRSVGLGAVLAFAGILLTAILTIRRVKGALLLGILAVWGAAILCQLTGLYVPNAELGMASVLPDFSAGLAVPSLAPTFMQMDFTGLFTLNFLTVVLSFCLLYTSHIDQAKVGPRAALSVPLLAVGAVIALALPWDVLWRYFSWANQTLAMIVLWTGAVFLHKFGYPPKACFIAALPATFMSGVSVTYFFQAPECLGLSTAIAYPVGIVAAALFLGIFIWRTLIVGKDDVAPLHAAKN